MARYRIQVKKNRGCLGTCAYWFFIIMFSPIILPVWLIKLCLKSNKKKASANPPESIYYPNSKKVNWGSVDYYRAHPDFQREQTNIRDAKSAIDITSKIPVFLFWYNTIYNEYMKMSKRQEHANYAFAGWQSELALYPQKLASVVERAIADVYKLKTVKGQAKRLDSYILELNEARIFNEEIREAVQNEKDRLETLRDNILLSNI